MLGPQGYRTRRAVLTVAYAMISDGETASVVKVLLLLGIVGCVIGLKVIH